ncbi:Hypothetical Protein RRSL_01468 [Ralstonia solanacearum UW551]|uniref:Uncharacterized protein n=1 Tax=Ralstonia solanacearum (strain UW551) TaxID=342110 RepID=A0AB33V9G8_RALSU|nr:Hypothetical Protein RRSL_01468 [Ralstonia solanacearum UW551]
MGRLLPLHARGRAALRPRRADRAARGDRLRVPAAGAGDARRPGRTAGAVAAPAGGGHTELGHSLLPVRLRRTDADRRFHLRAQRGRAAVRRHRRLRLAGRADVVVARAGAGDRLCRRDRAGGRLVGPGCRTGRAGGGRRARRDRAVRPGQQLYQAPPDRRAAAGRGHRQPGRGGHCAGTAGGMAVAGAHAHRQRLVPRDRPRHRLYGDRLHPVLPASCPCRPDARGVGDLPDPGVRRAVGHPVPGRTADAEHGGRLRGDPVGHIAVHRYAGPRQARERQRGQRRQQQGFAAAPGPLRAAPETTRRPGRTPCEGGARRPASDRTTDAGRTAAGWPVTHRLLNPHMRLPTPSVIG